MGLNAWSESRLGSGLRLLSGRTEVGYCWLRLVIPGGAACDPPNRQGLTWLTVKMLFGDQNDGFMASMRDRGVRFHVGIRRSSTIIDARGVGNLLGSSRAIFSRLQNPAFRLEAWERLVLYADRESQRLRQEPAWVAEQAVRRRLYGTGTSSGRGVFPLPETTGSASLAECEQHYRKHFGARGSALIALGRLDSRTASVWERDWNPAAQSAEITDNAPPGASPGGDILTGDFGRSAICIGGHGPVPGSPEYCGAMVGNSILARAGLGGRLGSAMRQSGASYSHRSYLSPLTEPGPWLVAAEVPHTSAQDALQIMLRELACFTKRLCTNDELKEAKDRLKTDLAADNRRATLIAEATTAHLAALDLNWRETLLLAIDSVRPEEVRSVSCRCLGESGYSTALVTTPIVWENSPTCEHWPFSAGTEFPPPRETPLASV